MLLLTGMNSCYQEFMDRAKHPAVRDLAWVLGSPNLLWAEDPAFSQKAVTDPWCQEHFKRFLPHLIQREADPGPLESWIQSRPSQRLGRYFETLTAYWLHHGTGLTEVMQSLKVKNQHRTLGEFDFLFYDQVSDQSIHLEIAVKFYLRRGDGNSWDHFTGPDGRDSLAHKLHTLFAKQTLLGETPEGCQALAGWRPAAPVVPKVMVKGYIFDPLKEWQAACYPSGPLNGLSERRLRGWWVDMDHESGVWEEFLEGRPDSFWSVVPKHRWLSPDRGQSGTEILTGELLMETLKQTFTAHPGAQLVSELRQDKGGDGYREISRGFVVPTLLQ